MLSLRPPKSQRSEPVGEPSGRSGSLPDEWDDLPGGSESLPGRSEDLPDGWDDRTVRKTLRLVRKTFPAARKVARVNVSKMWENSLEIR